MCHLPKYLVLNVNLARMLNYMMKNQRREVEEEVEVVEEMVEGDIDEEMEKVHETLLLDLQQVMEKRWRSWVSLL